MAHSETLDVLAQGALTKYYKPAGFKQQKIISHSSGGWKCKTKGLADSVAGENPLLGS